MAIQTAEPGIYLESRESINRPRILITAGEPAGIGPDVTIQIAQKDWPAELIVIADPDLLTQRAKQLNLPLQLVQADFNQPATIHSPGTLHIIPVSLQVEVIPGQLAIANANYVLQTLEIATYLCLQHKNTALVTGPVHKGIINQAGIAFSGHTEFFAERCQVPQTVMLFVADQLKVALATTHLPLAKVSSAITKERLQTTLLLLHEALINQFKIGLPQIFVCGLNPHAGESGYLGREEIDIITPVVAKLREEHLHLTGPLPADTIFTPEHLQKADAILAMYHDQALPIVKYIGFGNAVNMTLGLPFIRTSVDHGTALDKAGTLLADASSMEKALELAISLIPP